MIDKNSQDLTKNIDENFLAIMKCLVDLPQLGREELFSALEWRGNIAELSKRITKDPVEFKRVLDVMGVLDKILFQRLQNIFDKINSKSFGETNEAEKNKVKDFRKYGWEEINTNFFDKYRIDLSNDDLLRFFDGSTPLWQDSISDKIPRRSIVQEIIKNIEAVYISQRPSIVLLTGAGGEGKTTALRQAVYDLTQKSVNLLWHYKPNTSLEDSMIEMIAHSNKKWVLVSDEADLIASDLYRVVKLLHATGINNIHFLLCCREVDWNLIGANRWAWSKYCDMRPPLVLKGLSSEDAKSIINAWSLGELGDKGLGRLSSFGEEAAVKELLDISRKESGSSEGSFLGAMLRTRYGTDISAHVQDILLRFHNFKPANLNKTLLEVYAYISALHAENRPLLRKIILARTLGCTTDDLDSEVLGPLGREAGITEAGDFVLTRHRAIAESAVQIMKNTYYINTKNYIIQLIESAREIFIDSDYSTHIIPEISDWSYLSSYFFKKDDKENKNFGLRIARVLNEKEPDDAYFVSARGRLLRLNGNKTESIKIFRNSITRIASLHKDDRPFYYEWSTCEGVAGNHSLAAWLAGISLADDTSPQELDNYRTKISLNGISIAFFHLAQSRNKVYYQASVAATLLGLLIKSDENTIRTQKNLLTTKDKLGITSLQSTTPNILSLIDDLCKGIIESWLGREANLPDCVPKGDLLRFNLLKEFINRH